MMNYHYIQSIYHNHRKSKWEAAMGINAMVSLVQHSSFPITIQYCLKFSEQLSSHRFAEKHLNRFLISFSIWTLTSSLIRSSPILPIFFHCSLQLEISFWSYGKHPQPGEIQSYRQKELILFWSLGIKTFFFFVQNGKFVAKIALK